MKTPRARIAAASLRSSPRWMRRTGLRKPLRIESACFALVPAAFLCCQVGETFTLGHSTSSSGGVGGTDGPSSGGGTGGEVGDGDGDGEAPGGLGGGGTLNESQLPLHFSSLALIAELSGESKDENPTLSADTLAICFTSDRDGGSGGIDVWCSQRPGRDEPFEAPRALDELNTDRFESSSALSLDGLGIWFGSEREGGKGGLDIWFSERSSITDLFGPPRPVVELNTEFDEIPRPPGGPVPTMPLASRQGDGPYATLLSDLGADGVFGSKTPTGLASAEDQSLVDAQISQDGLLLVFTLSPDGDDPGNLYAAERASLQDPFANPKALRGVNSDGDDRDPWLSPDGGTLYFASDKNGDFDLYAAQRHSAAED